MSQLLINEYLRQLDVIKKVSGSTRETIVREAFKDLLKDWGRQFNLVFLAEFPLKTATKANITVDGVLMHELRMPLGYWEAKDERDDLNEEIDKKLRKGYPQDNIIFSDDITAVLIQHNEEVLRCDMTDTAKLSQLLKLFFGYERREIADFRAAVGQFKQDLPAVLGALREMIDAQEKSNEQFRRASAKFLEHAHEAINPALTDADVREMLIQHILTEEIFSKIFDSEFHRENNVARELYALESEFFTGALKKQTLKSLETYYAAIRAAAAQISSHGEKQTFLKVIYENFYKVYNQRAADRLGVVYTPNEIVRFMIDGADWLCEKHFGRNLVDKSVEILDPATGTGTFICELLEHFRGQPKKLEAKYKNELHANEVAILPYYVANLNIEATYAAITGAYEEFPNLCFVDTLDNVGLHTSARGVNADLFAGVSEENVARIKRQNSRKISVIIGNPPYRANQKSENENNKNRDYPEIDKRIRNTYVAESGSQKTKAYDPFVRFFRWASDRLLQDGIIAFVTNRAFIDKDWSDGFRKVVGREFDEIYIVDLGGDVRSNPKLNGKRNNVFGIQTGVAISFLVKSKSGSGTSRSARIFYCSRPEAETAEEKLAFLSGVQFSDMEFTELQPDKESNWLAGEASEDDPPLADKRVKSGRSKAAIFRLFSWGNSSNRDEWVYDIDAPTELAKAAYMCATFNELSSAGDHTFPDDVKWSGDLKTRFLQGRKGSFAESNLVEAYWRPFSKVFLYGEKLFNDRLTENHFAAFGPDLRRKNKVLMVCGHPQVPFTVHAIDRLPDAGYASRATQMFPRWLYAQDGTAIDNITDWALTKFTRYFKSTTGATGRGRKITKDALFSYCYGVLHDQGYRQKYSVNLKRDLPRIPFYADFWKWSEWGEALLGLHINYESARPFALERIETPDSKARAAHQLPKAILRSKPEIGSIIIDSETVLRGVPARAWNYKLGNRSAIDWVLEHYKERKPKDPVIREKFDAYRFVDHKEQVIGLLARIVTVSVETLAVLESMHGAARE